MTIEAILSVINQKGLHARAAAKLVALAGEFEAEIEVGHQDQFVSALSIMGLMMFGAAQGSELSVKANGGDAEAAVMAIQNLFADRFGEGV